MALLTIIQDATDSLLNTQRPSTVAGTQDETVRQMVSMVNEEGQNLVGFYPWQCLTRVVEKTALTTEDQGSLATLAPGFLLIIDDTVWLGSMPFKPIGPITAQERTGLEAFKINNPMWSYWIEGDHLKIKRPPVSGQRLHFRYQSKYWAKSATGVEKDRMTADTDVSVLPEFVLTLAVIWRWLQRNGMPYEQEYLNYRNALGQFTGRDGMRPSLSVTGGARGYSPMQSVVGGVFRT